MVSDKVEIVQRHISKTLFHSIQERGVYEEVPPGWGAGYGECGANREVPFDESPPYLPKRK